MTWVAYVDESMHAGNDACPPTYILAAAALDQVDLEATRSVVDSLARRRGVRFHWRDADDRARRVAADVVASLPAIHLVVVGTRLDPPRQERGRRQCLARLLHELDLAGAGLVRLEARRPVQNRRDLLAVDAFRAAGVIGTEVQVSHVLPSGPDGDCLAWLPDVVAGAVRAALDGGDGYRKVLDPVLTVIEINLK